MRIQHGPNPTFHTLNRLLQLRLQLLRRARRAGPEVPSRGRLGDPRVIRAGREREVQVGVGGGRGLAVRVHEQQAAARGVPALVVEHDGQDGEAVALADPVDGAGHGEEEGAVADDLADEAVRARGEFDAEGGAAGPAEAAAAAVEEGARDGGEELVGDEGGEGDGFDGEDCGRGKEVAEAGG